MAVDQSQFIAIARKSDGCALAELDVNAIRENTVDGCGLDPGDLLELVAARVERNAQDAAIAVFIEGLQDGFARNDVIAGQLDLLGL